jgi:hypothetical protein
LHRSTRAVGQTKRDGAGMDDRWFTGKHPSGEVVFSIEVLKTGVLRVRDDLWEHTCLDLNLLELQATERDQGFNASDDPNEWDTQECSLRRTDAALQILVDRTEYLGWIAEWEAFLERTEEYRRTSRIFPSAGERLVADATHALELLRAQCLDWIGLHPEVTALVRQHEGAP